MNIFGHEIPILLVCLPISLILSVVIALTSKEGRPRPAMFFILASCTMAILWIYIVANFVMDFLQFLQYVSGLDKILLSLSLLSLGNSLGDWFVDRAMAKKGFGVMAITGVFSGQYFNLMFGFALNCLFSYLA